MVRDRGEEFDKHLTEDAIYFEYMQHFDELHDGPKDILRTSQHMWVMSIWRVI